MFFKKIQWLILTIVAFTSGIIVTVQWIGSDYGMELWDLVKKPDIVEKVIQIEVVKVVVISDNHKIQMINQEYRDALLKLSAVIYSNDNYGKTMYDIMHQYAVKALSVPEVISNMDEK